ncbi:MAG TPA: DUF502 domain-containing protein [Gemmatimonadaceae bacterium]|nr:DUF502 domain-containing protein [Gemmatimonadaceae bacterium]
MRRLINYFIRGLVVTAPLALTLYVCWYLFHWVDNWLGLSIPGVGFVITVVLITLIGVLASSLVTRGAVAAMDRALQRLPVVRLVYGSTRDFLNAFVGEQRRFDKPVLVSVAAGDQAHMLGFVTAESVDVLGLTGYVAVYLPQSYGFSGTLVVVPAARVRPLAADSADVLAFIVSGGISGALKRPPTDTALTQPDQARTARLQEKGRGAGETESAGR